MAFGEIILDISLYFHFNKPNVKKHPYDVKIIQMLFAVFIRTADGRGLVLQDGADLAQHLTIGLEALEDILLSSHAKVPPKFSLGWEGCRNVDSPLESLIWFAGITSGRRCAASRRNFPWT